MDSCFTCGNVNCMDLALHGNIVGCVNWIPSLNLNNKNNNECEFCNNNHPEYDSMNGIYNKELTLESSGWDTYNDCINYVRINVYYCPMCGRKL